MMTDSKDNHQILSKAGNRTDVQSSITLNGQSLTGEQLKVDTPSDNDVILIEEHAKPARMMSVCEMCKCQVSKYTCPGCSMKTCSLPCVKQHKHKFSCTGERNKTAFIDLTQYADGNLLNDYRFLEEAERTLYSNKLVPRGKNRGQSIHPYPHSKRSKLLMTAAAKRGIKLRILPVFLSKNKENTSYFTVASDSLDWHVEWLFVTSTTTLKVKDERIKESIKVKDAVSKFTNAVEYPHLRKSLEGFPKDEMTKCKFFLKVEGLPANMIRYIDLNPDLTVSKNLEGTCLTEHPSIHVVQPGDDIDSYTLLSKKDIPFMATENVNHVIRYRPELSIREDCQSELLNPHSDIYVPDA